MLQKPPKAKSKQCSKDKPKKTCYNNNDEDENKENRVIRNIKVNSSRRAFGQNIVDNRSSNIIIIGNAFDIGKKQSLSKDNTKRIEVSNKNNSSATHVNYGEKKAPLPMSGCNSSKSRSIKQLKEPNRSVLDSKAIETLLLHKSSSVRNSAKGCYDNKDNRKKCSSNSNSTNNSTKNINRQRNIPNTSLTIAYSLSLNNNNSKALTTTTNQIKETNQGNKDTSQFEYEEKPNLPPQKITNYPIAIIQEPYTQLSHNQPKEKPIEQKDETPQLLFNDLPLNNPQYPSEYINTIYHNLLLEEFSLTTTQKAVFDYMKYQTEINESMRSILTDWLIDVHLKFRFTEETLYMTISIIDRYLSVQNVTKGKLQLVGIAALMIACKHEEIDLPKVKDFIYITDNAYTKEELFKMEYQILSKLQFDFLIPSSLKYYEILCTGFNFANQQMFLGKYLMETFLIDIKMLKYKASIIACACIYIVMKFSKMPNYASSYDKKYYTLTDHSIVHYSVKECAKDICLFVDDIAKTQYTSTQNKYSKSEYERVALLLLGK